jgi:4-hydroxy-tetrahydrodipicolinate synthase
MVCLGAYGLMNASEIFRAKSQNCIRRREGFRRGRALHYELYELNNAVFFDINPIPMKYMMKRLGIIPNELHRLPMVPSTPELRTKLDGVLSRAGLI